MRTRYQMVMFGFLCVAITAQAADEFPVGRFTSDLGGGQNKWAIQIDKDGKYSLSVNGTKIESGNYTATAKEVEFAAEDDKDRKAKYTWSLAKGKLTFVKVQEHKVARDAALTASPWGRVGAPLADVPESIDTSAIPKDLVKWADHENPELRYIAAKELGGYGAPAVPLLVRLLKDQNLAVTELAALSLGKIGAAARSALPALLAAAKDGTGIVRYYAIEAIRKIDPASDQIVPLLVALLGDQHGHNRLWAARDLRKIDPAHTTAAVTSLVKLLGSDDKFYRSSSAEELGKIGSSEATPALGKLLQDPDPFVRTKAATALGEIGPSAEGAVPSLIESLKDENPIVRLEAVKAVGKIGPAARPAVPSLLEMLDDKANPDIRSAVEDALEKIAPGELTARRRRPYLIGLGITVVCLGTVSAAFWYRRYRKRDSKTSRAEPGAAPDRRGM